MDKTRIDHIFNVFGYFGNVARVKVVPQKNMVLVDFATPEECQNAIHFVKDSLTLFGCPLHVTFSKYPKLVIPPGIANDQMRDYTTNPRIHRYPQGIASERVRWIVNPTTRLHVILTGRVPPSFKEDLHTLFERAGSVVSCAIEPNNKADGFKVAMALVEMASVEDATNALAILHNHELPNGSKLFVSFTNKKR